MEKDKKTKKQTTGIISKVKSLLFRSRKRTIITILVLLLLAFGAWQVFGKKSNTPQYQTAQAQRGSIIQSVTESGNIATGSQAGVGSPTTGIVTEIYVKDGENVTAGQDLFKVKSTATAQEIASAYAQYQNALVSANTAAQNKISAQATLEKDRQAIINASTAVTNMQNNLNVIPVIHKFATLNLT